jgi:hypothetical protein
MTKLLSLTIALAFAVGCGGGKKNETTTTNKDQTTDTTQGSGSATQTAGDGTPCAQEVALECPDGQIDGCLKTPAEGDTHKCVAK